MKKLLSLLAVATFAVSTSVVNAQTVQTHTKVAATSKTSKTAVRTTRTDATPDIQVSVKTHTNAAPARSYNRSTKVSSATHVKANGSAGTVQNKTTTTTSKSTM